MQYAINMSRNAQTKRLNEYHNKLQIFETVFNCEQLGVLVVSGKKKKQQNGDPSRSTITKNKNLFLKQEISDLAI